MRTTLRILVLCAALVLGVAPAAAQFQRNGAITVQPFERGQMIWRADNGFYLGPRQQRPTDRIRG